MGIDAETVAEARFETTAAAATAATSTVAVAVAVLRVISTYSAPEQSGQQVL